MGFSSISNQMSGHVILNIDKVKSMLSRDKKKTLETVYKRFELFVQGRLPKKFL